MKVILALIIALYSHHAMAASCPAFIDAFHQCVAKAKCDDIATCELAQKCEIKCWDKFPALGGRCTGEESDPIAVDPHGEEYCSEEDDDSDE